MLMSNAQPSIQVEKRNATGSKETKGLRATGIVPGILYGSMLEGAIPIQMTARDLTVLREHTEESSLINVILEGKTYKSLIKEVQENPLKSEVYNIDFYAPNLKESVESEVHLVFTGDSESEHTGNILVMSADSIEISALPESLPEHLEVDLSVLKTTDDMIRAQDIPLPEGVALESDADLVIAYTEEPKDAEQELTGEELDQLEQQQTESQEEA